MAVLKIILWCLLASFLIGCVLVKYALNSGMKVPTNQELIAGTKAVIEAKKNSEKKNTDNKSAESKTTVKASDIKKFKKAQAQNKN